ncbi:hypothetical protein MCOR03_000667 [Pyricularia oryzae]|nr:hypothetical protein MCOR05_004951 [Pyricularia oryzae]KAI6568048.1 hypothetical protein MCOR03_000667 [Pyricularia oryzae]
MFLTCCLEKGRIVLFFKHYPLLDVDFYHIHTASRLHQLCNVVLGLHSSLFQAAQQPGSVVEEDANAGSGVTLRRKIESSLHCHASPDFERGISGEQDQNSNFRETLPAEKRYQRRLFVDETRCLLLQEEEPPTPCSRFRVDNPVQNLEESVIVVYRILKSITIRVVHLTLEKWQTLEPVPSRIWPQRKVSGSCRGGTADQSAAQTFKVCLAAPLDARFGLYSGEAAACSQEILLD